MVNGSAPYYLIKKKKSYDLQRQLWNFSYYCKKSSCKIDTQLCKKKSLKIKNIKNITSNYKGKVKTITKIDKKFKNTWLKQSICKFISYPSN